jgi:TolB protein
LRQAVIFLQAAVLILSGCSQEAAAPFPVRGIAFVSDRDGNWEIYSIQANGSGLTRLTENPAVDADPGWSPDGSQIVFRSRRDGSSDLFTMQPNGSNPHNLTEDPEDSFDDEFAPAWNPDGEVLALYTDRFPPAPECPLGVHRLALFPLGGRHEEIRLLDIPAGEQETFSWSPDGHFLAYASGCHGTEPRLFVWERDIGQTRPLTEEAFLQTNPAWSPDGRFLAFVSNIKGNSDIFRYELATGDLVNITQNPSLDTQPSWSPDGESIAFVTNRDGNQEIYRMGADGSGLQNLTDHPGSDWDPAWSPIP